MFKRLLSSVMVLVLAGVICGTVYAQDEVVVSDTQTWGRFEDNVSDGGIVRVVAGGNLTITERSDIDNDRQLIVEQGGVFTADARVDMNSGGRVIMQGGEFYSNVDFKFPDSSGDQNVQIWVYSGTMVFEGDGIQSFASRGSTLYMGGGVFRAGNANGAGETPGSPSWNIEVIPGYAMFTITDLGDGWVEVAGESPFFASGPDPEDGIDDVLRDGVSLNWTPGEYAATHNVYFGESFEDVNAGTVPTYADLDVNAVALDRLEFGQTYYWRVDEVNGAPDYDVLTGKVWSFQVEPYSRLVPGEALTVTASSSANELSTPERTVDGSGLADDNTHTMRTEDMWFSDNPDLDPWIQYEFDEIQKLDVMNIWNSNSSAEMAIGWSVKDVQIEYSVDGDTWDVLENVNQFNRAPGSSSYDQYDEIDFAGAAAKYVRLNIQSNWGGLLMSYSLSEVQFYVIPAGARLPEPASGSGAVRPDAVVTWRAGRGAEQHSIFVSADADEVAQGLVSPVTTYVNNLDLSTLDLELGQTYYWRVDEVNEAEATSTWAGPVWRFTVADVLTVEDFERFGNESPDRPFQSWLDGFGFSEDEFFAQGYGGNGTGSGIGHDIWSLSSPQYGGDIMETDITSTGVGKALPLYYTNTGGVASETQRTFPAPQDWTLGGVQTLSIAFRGQVGNTGTLYLKIDDVKVTYPLNASHMAMSAWQAWNIELADVGADLSSVSEIAIGVDGSGASGMLLIDDMKLYAQSGEMVSPVDPGNSGLLAQYLFEGNANDSSGRGLHGQMTGSQVASPGVGNQGSAVQINPGGYVDLGNPAALNFDTGDWTIGAWFKTTLADDRGTIVGNGGDDGGGHRYALIIGENQDGVVSLILDDDASKVTVVSSSVVSDDQWHFVAAQREGTEIRVYMDGQLEGADTVDAGYDLSGTSQYNAYIGALTSNSSGSLQKLFNGLVDEVSIYDRALTSEEILWLSGVQSSIHKPF
ncbi:MAG: DUF4457 domain-containing protein [Planctomycetes bacterium]|nr:DUF4457 domain-containing protein [Planctomycetota bacterium]